MPLYIFAILDTITHVSHPAKILKAVKCARPSPLLDCLKASLHPARSRYKAPYVGKYLKVFFSL